jgi:gamma-tubulin complex component 3
MSNRENRILSAVDSLIQHIVPKDPREDPEDAQDRHDNCLELVTAILNR